MDCITHAKQHKHKIYVAHDEKIVKKPHLILFDMSNGEVIRDSSLTSIANECNDGF